MRISFISWLVILSFTSVSVGQDQPVPDYLIRQDFPDSVGNVSLMTLQGQRTTYGEMIQSFRGKKIVIDVWASWCRDCIIGLPKLEALKKKTSPDNVVYVFLSIDEMDATWRAAIERYGMRGAHFRVESGWKNPLSNYIVLDWVPRYMVLTKEGRVVMPKAIDADSPAMEKALLVTDIPGSSVHR